MSESSATSDRLAEGRRVAAVATVLTLLLAAAKGLVGYVRHSPALTADAVHSGADALAIFAAWLGIKLAERRPTERFPYGLYRAETLASLVVSAIILLAGIDMLVGSLHKLGAGGGSPSYTVDVLIVAAGSAALSFVIFLWERRIGQRIGSQSLLANADESRADIITSAAVFVGTGASCLRLPYVELAVAAMLSLLIIWLGAKHGRLAVYALLDASLDRELEDRAREIAEAIPGVMAVDEMRLRRAGLFHFGTAQISVRKSIDVNRGHEAAEQVVANVQQAISQIETLTVHVEPFRPETQIAMVPAQGDHLDSLLSQHLGRAEFFLFATVSPDGIELTDCLENASRGAAARAGLSAVNEALTAHEVDAVLTLQIGEIAFHTLRDHYVDIYGAPEGTAREALAQFAAQSLPPIVKPTHASEGAGASSAHDDAEEV